MGVRLFGRRPRDTETPLLPHPGVEAAVPRDAVVVHEDVVAPQEPPREAAPATAPAPTPPPPPLPRPTPQARPRPAAPRPRDVARATHYPVTVTVVSRGTNLPVRGVDVRVHVTTEAGLRDDDTPAAASTGRRRHDRFPVASSVTEDDGRARFLLAPGVYVVTLGDAWSPASHRLVVTRRTHVVVEVDDALNRQPLTVTVTRRGIPVAGTRVEVQGGWDATTGPDGTCVFLLPVGSHQLRVEGETLKVAHRGEGTVVFALPERVDLPDDAWEPAPPEAWEEDPFTILQRPRPARRPPGPVLEGASRPRSKPRRPRSMPPRPAPVAPPQEERLLSPSRYDDEEPSTTLSFTTRVTWDADG